MPDGGWVVRRERREPRSWRMGGTGKAEAVGMACHGGRLTALSLFVGIVLHSCVTLAAFTSGDLIYRNDNHRTIV